MRRALGYECKHFLKAEKSEQEEEDRHDVCDLFVGDEGSTKIRTPLSWVLTPVVTHFRDCSIWIENVYLVRFVFNKPPQHFVPVNIAM